MHLVDGWFGSLWRSWISIVMFYIEILRLNKKKKTIGLTEKTVSILLLLLLFVFPPEFIALFILARLPPFFPVFSGLFFSVISPRDRKTKRRQFHFHAGRIEFIVSGVCVCVCARGDRSVHATVECEIPRERIFHNSIIIRYRNSVERLKFVWKNVGTEVYFQSVCNRLILKMFRLFFFVCLKEYLYTYKPLLGRSFSRFFSFGLLFEVL